MGADYRDRTNIAFGPIQAYAKNHRRVTHVNGTAIRLALQDANGGRSASSDLLRLREGEHPGMGDLRALLPSIGSVVWEFSKAQTGFDLTTITDGIHVTVSMTGLDESDDRSVEAQLRGAAARLVVALHYGG